MKAWQYLLALTATSKAQTQILPGHALKISSPNSYIAGRGLTRILTIIKKEALFCLFYPAKLKGMSGGTETGRVQIFLRTRWLAQFSLSRFMSSFTAILPAIVKCR